MRRIAISTLALLLLGLPPALAQAWSEEQIGMNFYQLMEQEWVPGFYLAVRENGDVVENVLGVLNRVPFSASGDPRTGVLCPHLIGAGGSPKLDGGGLLTQWVGSATPVSKLLEDVFAPNSRIGPAELTPFELTQGVTLGPVVIIDAFELESLAKWMAQHGSQPFNLADIDDVERLWRAVNGDAVPPIEDPTELALVHGHLVLFHLLKSLAPGPLTVDLVSMDDPRTIRITAGSSATMEVQLVAIEFDDPPSIVPALEAVAAIEVPAVVNMSWGLVYCRLLDDLESPDTDVDDQRYATHVELMADRIAAHPDLSSFVVDNLCELEVEGTSLRDRYEGPGENPCDDGQFNPDFHIGLVTTATHAALDALAEANTIIEDLVASRPVMFFASAGNQGLPYPMPPASFNEVIGVAACVTTPGAGAKKAGFSNAPDFGSAGSGQPGLIALGAWFEVPLGGAPALGYYGTSFAAPYAAARAATGKTAESLGCD